jgi:hypothetical protein
MEAFPPQPEDAPCCGDRDTPNKGIHRAGFPEENYVTGIFRKMMI